MSAPKRASTGIPIRPGHVLYPMLAAYALVCLLFGPIGRQVTDDMPESKTHPSFPDHFWPYPILAMAVLVTLGLLAVVGQPLLQLGQAADPRAAIIPRPEWYFLSLFQFAKLGPALLTSILGARTAAVHSLVLQRTRLRRVRPTPSQKMDNSPSSFRRKNPTGCPPRRPGRQPASGHLKRETSSFPKFAIHSDPKATSTSVLPSPGNSSYCLTIVALAVSRTVSRPTP